MPIHSSRSVAVALVAAATFVDILAYSIAVPVLPDLSRRFGASPTVIGLLFASFGLTLLVVSVPMGARSDRTGRKIPLVAGLVALAAASILFAFAPNLWWLFAARLVQGAADAVTWVVGFALVADLFSAAERGRVMGLVMSSASFGFMIGPTLGGWLYETGGIERPYLAVAIWSLAVAVGFVVLRLPGPSAAAEPVSMTAVLRDRGVAACGLAVVVIGGTLAMMEPTYALFLASKLELGPARIGLVFGTAAVVSGASHPVFGRLADRWGSRRLTLVGLVAIGMTLPLPSFAWNFPSAVGLGLVQTVAVAVAITPSLAYMGEAVSAASAGSFGVAYGLYNFAWALGLLVGPAAGGFLFERVGFRNLTLGWAPLVAATAVALAWTARVSAPMSASQRG